MRIVEMKTPEIWEQEPTFVGMCEHIARCAALCYNSEPKKGGDAVHFVKRLAKNGHGRPLEFGAVNMVVTNDEQERLKWVVSRGSWASYVVEHGKMYATVNLRSLLDYGMRMDDVERLMDNWQGHDLFPKRLTIHYPCISRGIADEIRTHTTLSTLMRSTRYVSSENDGDVEFVKPYWFNDKIVNDMTFHAGLEAIETAYKDLLANGLKKQMARELLPLCVKTEMVQCGFDPAWDNMLKLRMGNGAHPDAQKIAKMAREAIIKYKTSLEL